MKRTALTPWRGIAMLAGMVLLSLGACKKDANVTPENTPTQTNPSKFDFKPTALATVLTSYKSSPVVNYTGKSNLTISGLAIQGGSVPCISLSNCNNVHITQCALSNSTTVGIQLYNCTNITIDYCYFTKVSTGVYAVLCTAGNITVQNNQFLNMQGPFPRGQAVQFNQCSGAGLAIQYNHIQNIIGQCNTYEVINCYKTHGTAASPVQVKGNWILGAGPNNTSGGLQLGDNGGSYITATGNVLVNAGAVALSVSGGDHVDVENNTVYSTSQSFTNTGISCWAQAGYAITNVTIANNKIKFLKSTGIESDYWIGPNTPTPTGWSTNTWNAAVTAAILPSTIITANAATVPLAPATTTTTTSTSTSTAAATGITTSSPINYTGKSNISISNLVINGGSVPCITLTNCNGVYINACTLQNSTDAAIVLNNCTNVTIQSNNIANVAAGIVAKNCPSGGIKVFTNLMKNMQGPSYDGTFVQYVSVGGANNSISGNKMQNFTGASSPVNAIEVVSSNGTSASPITVSNNQLEGGSSNTSGGGIVLGKSGGSYQIATGNTMVNPGQFGASIVGGNNISITNNQIFGAKAAWTNVGIFVQGQGGMNVSAATVSGNKVNFTNASGAQASDWLAAGATTPSGWSTNSWGSSAVTAALLPTTLVSF